ncbi:MAG: DUF6569 family protein [Gaiellaceae bacterium]
MTITNRELFYRDPTGTRIPNDGVAKVFRPTTTDQWDVLQWELKSFVCEGEYARGLERILGSFLTNLNASQAQQPAVWVSGFYGSGKSHLVRCLPADSLGNERSPMIDTFIQLGEPVEHRGIVIAPIFPRRTPVAGYATLEDALPLGLRIGEVSEAGAVPELAVENPTDGNVLLYDGEELLGAKQNRILNMTVLVPAQSKLPIPVSCVEEGRWHRRSADFAAAPHAAHPELRRRKAQRLAATPLARGIAQSEVWDEVRAKSARMGVHSKTGAQADVFRSREDELRDLERAFPLQPGQSGAVFALGDALCLDYVSRPKAFARLYPKLRAGYLLDALERIDRGPASQGRLDGFVGGIDAAARARGPAAGLGEDVRLHGHGLVGSVLELEDELIQVCAFTSDERSGQIARPSRRR